VFGAEDAMRDEARALALPSRVFPTLVQEGRASEVGHFVVLTDDLDGASPIGDTPHSFEAAIALVRAALDAAAELEARGFFWEPSPGDLYLRPDGRLLAVRARGARARPSGERLNAKRVVEALGDSLLPVPIVWGTPELLRLFVPRWNFSTVATRSIDGAREDVARAEATLLTKGDSTLADLCDPGLRRHHNEDAVSLARGERDGEPFQVMVVCDGVSSSTHAERASAIASEVTRDAIAQFARTGDVTLDAARGVEDAIRAAHAAICAEDIEYGDGSPPGTTVVAALVFGRTLTVGWVGDSRAYWVSEAGSELCTTDHSWINDVTMNGGLSVAEAMQSPLAHALTRCLGPLDRGDGVVQDVFPDVRQRALDGPGHLVLCTDGLWNYFPSASAIADLVRGAGVGADANAIARFLVCNALAEGGGDNVSVAVYSFI
jgi:serine/threonine protein phosphatase PrpC